MEILSIIINVILIIAIALLALKKNSNILNNVDIIDDDTLRKIYECITDVIELSEVSFNTYEEFKDYSIITVFTNMIKELEGLEDNKLIQSSKIILLDKINELFENVEINEQLYKKYQELSERTSEEKELIEDSNQPLEDTVDISGHLFL